MRELARMRLAKPEAHKIPICLSLAGGPIVAVTAMAPGFEVRVEKGDTLDSLLKCGWKIVETYSVPDDAEIERMLAEQT